MNTQQIGISPKTQAVVIANLAIGLVLVIAGVIADESTLTDIGIGVLAGSGIGGGAAYVAPPGEVAVQLPAEDDFESSDENLSPATNQKLGLDDETHNGTTTTEE